MRHTLRAGIALLVLGGLAGSTPGQSTGGTVEVVRAKARFGHSWRTGEPRHEIKLTLRVGPRSLPDDHVADAHALRVTLDGADLCSVEPGDDGYRAGKRGRWRFRGDAAGGRVTITADGRTGKLKLKLSGANLAGLRDGDADRLPLEVEIAGAVAESEASFRVVERSVLRWNGLVYHYGPAPAPDPDPVPGPGPMPGPPPAPKGPELASAILADMATRGVSSFPGSWRGSPAGGFDPQTRRCPDGTLAEVVVLAAPLPGSADMFSDTAYFCRASRTYWANRTGGFAGVNIWLGPYTLP